MKNTTITHTAEMANGAHVSFRTDVINDYATDIFMNGQCLGFAQSVVNEIKGSRLLGLAFITNPDIADPYIMDNEISRFHLTSSPRFSVEIPLLAL